MAPFGTMRERSAADGTQEEKRSTSVRVVSWKYRELLHILLDKDMSFHEWLDQKIDGEIQASGKGSHRATEQEPQR